MYFPWDKLAPFLEQANTYARANGCDVVDLSIGTPVDDVPESIQQALGAGANTPGYPKTVGSDALRQSICQWLKTMRHVSGVAPKNVIPTVGSKEAVALLPLLLGLGPDDAIVRPKFAYPTYDIGALAARCSIIKLDDFDARALEEATARLNAMKPARDEQYAGGTQYADRDQGAKDKRIKLIWLNYPRNPTGECVSTLKMRTLLEAARSVGAIVASDECYALFDWRENADVNAHGLKVHPSILDDDVCGGDFSGILMLYSLSKQLNLAGYRSSFLAGDEKLIARIGATRKQLGLITPEPIQRASIAAFEDVECTKVQLEKYRARHVRLQSALARAGYEVLHSEGSLYVWVKAKSGDCWEDLGFLAGRGLIVAPGEFYDETARGYLRISVTASDEHIDQFAHRIQ